MQFESFISAGEVDTGSNPASLLARHILESGEDLASIGIQVRKRGGKYTDFGRGFHLEHDEDSTEREQKETAKALAEAVVEVCADGQAEYDKPVDWKVTGYSEPDKGAPKSLFSESFKVAARRGPPTMKETQADVITASNALLRDIANDSHRNYMQVAKALVELIAPISAMSGNIAEKIRPSDAEVAHKTRMAELELEAAVAQADAANRRARNEQVTQTLSEMFGRLPLEQLGDVAKMVVQMHMERARAEKSKPTQETPEPQTLEPNVDPSAASTRTNLCQSSRTLADIIAGREDAIAASLGEMWEKVEPLARQDNESAFAALAKALRAEMEALPLQEQIELFTGLSTALGDEGRIDRLRAFFKDADLI